jgi:hypothetical protein
MCERYLHTFRAAAESAPFFPVETAEVATEEHGENGRGRVWFADSPGTRAHVPSHLRAVAAPTAN